MARGESPKERSLTGGVLVAGVLVAALGGLALVSMTARSCTAAPPYMPPSEPFAGAQSMFTALRWRDTGRGAPGTPLAADAVVARSMVEAALTARGYRPTGGDAQLLDLPADFDVPAMEGACGVLLVLGDGAAVLRGATVRGAGAAETTSDAGIPLELRAFDPSALPVPLCGAGTVYVEGTGRAAGHAWLFPGVVPSDVTATGIPVDALLAHAEAEHLLAPLGFVPRDELLVTTTTGAIPWVAPSGGCAPYVAVAIGGGSPQGSWSNYDVRPDRALVGGASCATRSDAAPTLSVPGRPAQVFVRAYERGAASTNPSPRVGAMRVTPLASLAPPTLPEAPLPSAGPR